MSKSITFTAYGIPQPQGSMRSFVNKKTGRAIVTSANPKNKPFRRIVTSAALAAMTCDVPMFGKGEPVAVVLMFTFIKPKSSKNKMPVVKPDVDKLARSVFDSLTGCVYWDDSQCITALVEKRYGDVAGVKVTVSAL